MDILFLEGQKTLDDFYTQVCRAVLRFDSAISLPSKNLTDVFGLIWWLMESGVRVILDEIQLLQEKQGGFFQFLKVCVLVFAKNHLTLLDYYCRY